MEKDNLKEFNNPDLRKRLQKLDKDNLGQILNEASKDAHSEISTVPCYVSSPESEPLKGFNWLKQVDSKKNEEFELNSEKDDAEDIEGNSVEDDKSEKRLEDPDPDVDPHNDPDSEDEMNEFVRKANTALKEESGAFKKEVSGMGSAASSDHEDTPTFTYSLQNPPHQSIKELLDWINDREGTMYMISETNEENLEIVDMMEPIDSDTEADPDEQKENLQLKEPEDKELLEDPIPAKPTEEEDINHKRNHILEAFQNGVRIPSRFDSRKFMTIKSTTVGFDQASIASVLEDNPYIGIPDVIKILGKKNSNWRLLNNLYLIDSCEEH